MKLEFKNITKDYSGLKALNDFSLKIDSGRIVGLLGSNGSGKTTLIKLVNGLITPTSGEVLINGKKPGIESKKIISYLPERSYLNMDMKVSEVLEFFEDFYEDFSKKNALELLKKLSINTNSRLKTMSKGTKEKVQLVLVMSRKADLYILDEPIGGVDPAARDYILETILNNFNKDATVIISTHLISDVEKILDDVIFISKGKLVLYEEADKLREKHKSSIDKIFREMFRC